MIQKIFLYLQRIYVYAKYSNGIPSSRYVNNNTIVEGLQPAVDGA